MNVPNLTNHSQAPFQALFRMCSQIRVDFVCETEPVYHDEQCMGASPMNFESCVSTHYGYHAIHRLENGACFVDKEKSCWSKA